MPQEEYTLHPHSEASHRALILENTELLATDSTQAGLHRFHGVTSHDVYTVFQLSSSGTAKVFAHYLHLFLSAISSFDNAHVFHQSD
jgi:hypothetical protein